MAVNHFDLIIIGSGPAGEKGAAYATGLGKKVAIIEKETAMGGAVANLGTLPSKTLREAALYITGYRQRRIHGMTLAIENHLNAQDLLYHERLVRQLEQARIRAQFEGNKVALYHGTASFLDAHTVHIARQSKADKGEIITGTIILIATGAVPYRPPIFPANHPAIYDSESILRMSEIPKNLTIVAGGVIGTEYACIFAAFGVQITLLEENSRLVPFLDADVSSTLLASMRAQNIDVRLDEQVVGCRARGMLMLALKSGSSLSTSAVLVTTGRRGNTASLNLQAVGLLANDLGLLSVNENYQTTQPNIYAVGDVTGFPSLASSAREAATHAVAHAFSPEKGRNLKHIQPYGIYTIPECSMAGETEDGLSMHGVPWVAGVAYYAGNARGQIIGAHAGFLKLLFHRQTLQLLGVHVIGEQASELVHLGLIALQTGANAELFLNTCFNYPTLSELYRSAALNAVAKCRPEASPPSSILKPHG
ncbi:MAG: Si-specific NAD(P)(+) transhydrogenase [Opitutaceae bacterium]|jgi:NAD(P) transhydrogenase